VLASVKDSDGIVYESGLVVKKITILATPSIDETIEKNKVRSDLSLIIGGAVGGILFILVILMIVLLVKKNRKPQQFEVSRMEDGTSKYN